MDGFYIVYFYNECDGEFGYDPGPGVLHRHVDKATARSIVKHLRKTARKNGTDGFMDYWFESDWED